MQQNIETIIPFTQIIASLIFLKCMLYVCRDDNRCGGCSHNLQAHHVISVPE